jgi:hypothetical protein
VLHWIQFPAPQRCLFFTSWRVPAEVVAGAAAAAWAVPVVEWDQSRPGIHLAPVSGENNDQPHLVGGVNDLE